MAGVLVNPIRPHKETFRAELAASGWGGIALCSFMAVTLD